MSFDAVNSDLMPSLRRTFTFTFRSERPCPWLLRHKWDLRRCHAAVGILLFIPPMESNHYNVSAGTL